MLFLLKVKQMYNLTFDLKDTTEYQNSEVNVINQVGLSRSS